MSEELKKEWEREFDDIIEHLPLMDNSRNLNNKWKKKFKSFISSLLAKQQEEFVKMIEDRMVDGYSDLSKYKNDILGELLADIKSKLSDLTKQENE